MIPIFNVILISDKDENAINDRKHALFHLSKYSDKLFGNIVYRIQIAVSNSIQVPVSFVFAAISKFWFSGFSRLTIYNLISRSTLDQIISELLTLRKYFTCSLIATFFFSFFAHVEHFWTCFKGIYVIIDNNYKLLIFQQVDVYLNEPIKIDELIKLANQSIQRRYLPCLSFWLYCI